MYCMNLGRAERLVDLQHLNPILLHLTENMSSLPVVLRCFGALSLCLVRHLFALHCVS